MKQAMMCWAKLVFALALITASRSVLAQSPQGSAQDHVLTYHGSPDRKGNFVLPGLTSQRAKSLYVDGKFHTWGEFFVPVQKYCSLTSHPRHNITALSIRAPLVVQ